LGSRYTSWVVFVLTLALLVSFIDRQIVALLVEPMKADIGLTDTQAGWLYGGFAIFYAAAGFPLAWLADRKSRRGIIAVGIFLWSLMTMACGLARSFWMLFIARIGVGVGEASLTPSTHSLLGDILPRERIPLAMSFFQLGAVVGSGLAFLIGGLVVEYVRYAPPVTWPIIGELFAWQLTFIYVGAPGVLVVLLMLTIKEPRRRVSDNPNQKSGTRELLAFYRTHWRTLLSHHAGFTFLVLAGYAFVFWTPSIFERIHHVPAEQASQVFGTIFIFAGAAGTLCAAWVAGRLMRRGRPDAIILTTLCGSIGLVIAIAVTQFAPTPFWAYVAYVPALFLVNSPFGLAQAALPVIAPAALRARVAAVFMVIGAIGNAFGPPLTGWVSDTIFPGADGLRWSLLSVTTIAGSIGVAFLVYGRRHYARSYEQATSYSEAQEPAQPQASD
jgi:MFS family permease